MPDRQTRRRPGHGDRGVPPGPTGPWDEPAHAAEDLFTPRQKRPEAGAGPHPVVEDLFTPRQRPAPPSPPVPPAPFPAGRGHDPSPFPAGPGPEPSPHQAGPQAPQPTSRRARRLAEAAQARAGGQVEAGDRGDLPVPADRAGRHHGPEQPLRPEQVERRERVDGPDRERPDGSDHWERPDQQDSSDGPDRYRPPRALLPVALLLAAWSATCLLDEVGQARVDVLLVLLAATSPYLALAAVPVVTLALRGRRWTSAAAGLVGGLLPWVFVLGYAAPAPQEEPRGPAVRTMIVNAHVGQADPAAVVQAVRDHAVDVLVVTELSGLLAHELTAQGLDAQLRPRWVQVPDQAQAGIGLWSRYDVGAVEEVAGTARPALRTSVDTGRGAVTLVAGHAVPPLPDVARWRADLEALGDAARVQGPVVLLGNLNATPWHPEFRRLAGGGLDDAADAAGRGLRSTWPSGSPVPLLPLDHALVGGGVAAEEVETIPLGGTDHRALLTTLTLPGGG